MILNIIIIIVLINILLVINQEEVKITALEFCNGCLYTVELYSHLSAETFKKLQLKDTLAGEAVEGNDIATLMCDNTFYDTYKLSMKFSCIKILSDYREIFLKTFEGSGNFDEMKSKNKIFQRTKSICVDQIKACKNTMFYDPIINIK